MPNSHKFLPAVTIVYPYQSDPKAQQNHCEVTGGKPPKLFYISYPNPQSQITIETVQWEVLLHTWTSRIISNRKEMYVCVNSTIDNVIDNGKSEETLLIGKK